MPIRLYVKEDAMANPTKYALRFLIIILLSGCSSSDKKATAEGVAALRKMASAVQDVEILISAGITKDEYSKRLADALLKFGNPEESCKQTVAKFPRADQAALATQACQNLSKAMDAFVYAKDYFGPLYNPSYDLWEKTFGEDEYAKARERFPNLAELEVAETNPENGYKSYARKEMLQALWQVASQDSQAARGIIERLGQM
jgi:major membrane immunogen (membrane-anchored lipoprotein)